MKNTMTNMLKVMAIGVAMMMAAGAANAGDERPEMHGNTILDVAEFGYCMETNQWTIVNFGHIGPVTDCTRVVYDHAKNEGTVRLNNTMYRLWVNPATRLEGAKHVEVFLTGTGLEESVKKESDAQLAAVWSVQVPHLTEKQRLQFLAQAMKDQDR
jgi:hypothetical protein